MAFRSLAHSRGCTTAGQALGQGTSARGRKSLRRKSLRRQSLRRQSLRANAAKKFKATTNSNHSLPVAENLLPQNFTAPCPNHVWVADITYIATDDGWLYVAVVLDPHPRKVVGSSMSAHDRHPGVRRAAYRAVCAQAARQMRSGREHESRGKCYDNAAMESWNHTSRSRRSTAKRLSRAR